MSKYSNWGLWPAFNDIDDRLSALEAAQKKPDAPTPEQREPGYYNIWGSLNYPFCAYWDGSRWLHNIGGGPCVFDQSSCRVGPRIPEPGEPK